MHDPRLPSRTAAAVVAMLLSAATGSTAEDPPDAITIGGMTAEGLVLSTTGASIARSIPLINTQKNPVDIVVHAPRLIAPDSTTIDTKWDIDGQATSPLSAKVPGLGTVQLTMTTELPVVGAYQGTLSLVYGDKRHPYAIKVTRTASKPGVTVTGLSAMAFAGSGARLIDFSLKESDGAKAVLNAPRVLSLTRKVGEKTLQAPATGVTFHTLDPKGQETPVGATLTVERNATVPILMRVPGAEPGEYAGTLHVASASGALDAVPFTFYVRRSGWLCAVLIATGVLLSSLLRWHVKSGRPRLILARRFLMLEADIDGVSGGYPDPEDKDVLGAIKARIQRVASDADVGQTAEVDATLKDIDAKLSLVPVWSTLRRRIAAVTASSAVDAARTVLEDARKFLVAHKNDSETDIKSQADAMRAALTTIDTEVRERLTKDITTTREMAEAAAVDLAADRKPEFKRDVLDVLATAENATKATPPDDKGARDSIDAATRAYARIATSDLEERLDAVERPAAIGQTEWEGLLEAVRKDVERAASAATGSDAVGAYESTYKRYLEILVRVASEELGVVRPRVPQTDVACHERLNKAGDLLNRARLRLRQRDVEGCRTSYDEAKLAIDDVVKQYPPPKPMSTTGMSAPAPATLHESATHVGLELSDPVSLDPPRERRSRAWSSIARVDRDLKMRDRIVSVVTGVVAVLFGIYLIWIDNLTWGSGKDMAAAVFWGLGLHQVAGNVLFAKLDLEQFERGLTGAGGDTAAP